MVSFTVSPSTQYVQSKLLPDNITSGGQSNTVSAKSIGDQVHFGIRKPATDNELKIAEEAIRSTQLAPLEASRRLVTLKSFFNGETIAKYPLLIQLLSTDFLRSPEAQTFRPSRQGTSKQLILGNIATADWAAHALFLRGLLERPLIAADIKLMDPEPIRLYARAVVLDQILGKRKQWSNHAMFLLTADIDTLRDKANALTQWCGEEFGQEHKDDWKIDPSLLIPATTTLQANIFLLNYFGFTPENNTSYFSDISTATDTLQSRVREHLKKQGCVFPDDAPLPTSPLAAERFEAYMANQPQLKQKIEFALANIVTSKK